MDFHVHTAVAVVFVILAEHFGIIGTAWTFSSSVALMAVAWYVVLRAGISIRPRAFLVKHRDALEFPSKNCKLVSRYIESICTSITISHIESKWNDDDRMK